MEIFLIYTCVCVCERSSDCGLSITCHVIQVKETMKNKEQYHSNLQRKCYTICFTHNKEKITFPQDNNSKHYSESCQNTTSQKSNKILKIRIWPPQSLELSPIELVWDELDGRIRCEFPNNDSELFQCLKNTWEGLLSTFFQNYFERMLKICKAVIKAGGGFIGENKIWCYCTFFLKSNADF